MLAGIVGHIKWGPYTAAAINGYRCTPTNKARTAWKLNATIVLADPFKMTQSPLVFIAKHKRGEWTFPIVDMPRRKDGLYQGPFAATVGAPRNILR